MLYNLLLYSHLLFIPQRSLFPLYISNSFHSDCFCLLYIIQSRVISFFCLSLSLYLSISISFSFSSFFGRSPSCFPFPKGNPLSPLFPQCDTVLEFSTTFSICYCDSVKVTPLYHNKGLRRALTTAERCTHKEFARFTDREILYSTSILNLHLCVCGGEGGGKNMCRHTGYV